MTLEPTQAFMKSVLYVTTLLMTFTIGVLLTNIPRAMSANRDQALHERESSLRMNLLLMRGAIDRYSTNVGHAPRSLNQLVESGFLKAIPVDPITGRRDWDEATTDLMCYQDLLVLEDVHSSSTVISSKGTPYREW